MTETAADFIDWLAGGCQCEQCNDRWRCGCRQRGQLASHCVDGRYVYECQDCGATWRYEDAP